MSPIKKYWVSINILQDKKERDLDEDNVITE